MVCKLIINCHYILYYTKTFHQTDPVIVHGSSYGSGSGLIFEIDCIEDARNIKECSYRPVDDTSNCTHVNDAGVMCIGT